MRRTEAQVILGELAAGQHGLVTSAQAAAHGVEGKTLQRLREANLIEQVGRGVYQVVGATTPSHLEIRVAWLRLDPERPAWERDGRGSRDGVVSHRSACQLHNLGDIPAPDVDLTVPGRLTTRERWVKLHRHDGPLPAEEITFVDGLPVTTVRRTILDLLSDRVDAGHIGGVIADAEHRGLIDLGELADKVGRFAERYAIHGATGAELLTALAAAAGQQLNRDRARAVLTEAASSGYGRAIRNMLAHQPLPEGFSDALAEAIITAQSPAEAPAGPDTSEWSRALNLLLAVQLAPAHEAAGHLADALSSPATVELRRELAARLLKLDPLAGTPSLLAALHEHDQALEAASPAASMAPDTVLLGPEAEQTLALAGMEPEKKTSGEPGP